MTVRSRGASLGGRFRPIRYCGRFLVWRRLPYTMDVETHGSKRCRRELKAFSDPVDERGERGGPESNGLQTFGRAMPKDQVQAFKRGMGSGCVKAASGHVQKIARAPSATHIIKGGKTRTKSPNQNCREPGNGRGPS